MLGGHVRRMCVPSQARSAELNPGNIFVNRAIVNIFFGP